MTSRQTTQAYQSICDLYAYFLTLMALMGSIFMLLKILPADIAATEELKAAFLFPQYVQPEMKERTLFLASIVLLLPLNFIAIKVISLPIICKSTLLANEFLQKTVVLAMPVILIFVISWSKLLALMTGGIKTYWLPACLTFMLAAVVFLSALTFRPVPKQPKQAFAQWMTPSLVVGLAVVILVSVLSFRLQSIFLVTDAGKWVAEFEAVFYTVSQVAAGKTLLADLPTQYGMYAEILKPIFSLTGLSIFTFTAVMSGLQITGLSSLFWLCLRLIKNNVLRLFAVVSLCLVIGHTWMLRMAVVGVNPGLNEVYQNWPIRFLFPALSVCVFYRFLYSKQDYKATAWLAGFAGLAITWNLDSGVAVFGSIMAYLTLQLIFPLYGNRTQQLKKNLWAMGVAAAWIMVFGIYLQLKAGHAIDWQNWLKYQQIFYKSGFGMLPMPTAASPWMAIVAVYVFAITGAVSRRVQKKYAPAWDTLFFIAILGLGIFPYYQGRSHILNISAIAWPAMLIAFILTDRTLRAIRIKQLPFVFAATFLPTVLLGLMFTAVFVSGLPVLLTTARYNAQVMLTKPKTPITENIAFILQQTKNTKTAAIFSQHQAVYFAETGLASAVSGPGVGEMILVSDLDQFFDQLLSKPVAHLFVQQDKLEQVLAKLQGRYKIKARSNYGLIYLSTD